MTKHKITKKDLPPLDISDSLERRKKRLETFRKAHIKRMQKLKEDPELYAEYKAKRAKRAKERYQSDDTYRQEQIERQKRYRAKKKS